MMSLIRSFNDVVYTIKRKYKLKTILIIIALAILFDLILFATWIVFVWFDLSFIHPINIENFRNGR
tara:strand:- start:3339 stop:3536 length:198 start_codon:yes stop_codon:yes gene_type:complete